MSSAQRTGSGILTPPPHRQMLELMHGAVLIVPVLPGGSSGNRSCFTQHLTLPQATGLGLFLLPLHTLNASGPA